MVTPLTDQRRSLTANSVGVFTGGIQIRREGISRISEAVVTSRYLRTGSGIWEDAVHRTLTNFLSSKKLNGRGERTTIEQFLCEVIKGNLGASPCELL